MNVVAFPAKPYREPPGEWQTAELARLLNACAAQIASGEASGWDVGATESGDPQLYLLGPAPEHDCILCISRLGRLYVLEDGRGGLIFEHESLVPLAEQAALALRRRKHAFLAQVAVAWCAMREFFEEKVEPVVAEPIEILTHVSPQLVALV